MFLNCDELVGRHWRCTSQLHSICCTWLINPRVHSLNADVCIIKWQEHQSYSEQRVRESTWSYPETPLMAKRTQYSWTRAGKLKKFWGSRDSTSQKGPSEPIGALKGCPQRRWAAKTEWEIKSPPCSRGRFIHTPRWLMRSVHVQSGQQTCCFLWYWRGRGGKNRLFDLRSDLFLTLWSRFKDGEPLHRPGLPWNYSLQQEFGLNVLEIRRWVTLWLPTQVDSLFAEELCRFHPVATLLN